MRVNRLESVDVVVVVVVAIAAATVIDDNDDGIDALSFRIQ